MSGVCLISTLHRGETGRSSGASNLTVLQGFSTLLYVTHLWKSK